MKILEIPQEEIAKRNFHEVNEFTQLKLKEAGFNLNEPISYSIDEATKMHVYKQCDEPYEPLKFETVITNGYVDSETIHAYTSKGWTFVCTLPARQVHPYAMDTDKITIFSRYNQPEKIGGLNEGKNRE